MSIRYEIIPVTPFAQNCSLLWCDETRRGAVVDPGGDVDRITAAIDQLGLTVEKILLTHGHIDHAGGTAELARRAHALAAAASAVRATEQKIATRQKDLEQLQEQRSKLQGMLDGAGTGFKTWPWMISAGVVPPNGYVPVRSSKSTMPSA